MATDTTSLGDRIKLYESMTAERIMPFVPIVIRLDGKCFSSWTRGLKRPYDPRLSDVFAQVTQTLVAETGATIGYTQSDEISLVLYETNPRSETFLNGRVQKLCSVLASMTTAWFNSAASTALPHKAGKHAYFDCRAFAVPNPVEAANAILWREIDATRNSIQSAARSVYSHKECHLKNQTQLLDMLHEKGIDWATAYPASFKRGQFVQRRKRMGKFTKAEIAKLPEKHDARSNPDLMVIRSEILRIPVPPLRRVINRDRVVCFGDIPEVESPEEEAA